MQTNYILIDFENVHVKSLALLKDSNAQVRVFLGPKNTRIPVELVLAMKALGERGDYISLEVAGHNALDFHIAFYLGKLVTENAHGHFHIISKDTGFDSLVRHLQRKGIHCKRVSSIEQMLGVEAVADNGTVAKQPGRPARAKGEPAQPPRAKQPPPVNAQNERTVEKAKETAARRPAPAARNKPEPAKPPVTPTVQSIIANLESRGSSRPRRLKTLVSTIKSLPLNLGDAEVAGVVEALQQLGKITVSGQQVSYRL